MEVREPCTCFSQGNSSHAGVPVLHQEVQDTECEPWQRLIDMIETAVETGVEEFSPLQHFTPEERSVIVTLPASIGRLKCVTHLNLYGSFLTRIPPEIGEMTSLRMFTPYCSYFLHWFPYEITRCSELSDSCVSTRALYGNHKYRPPFPHLGQQEPAAGTDLTTPEECSVCRCELDRSRVYRCWLSLHVGTDVLPLLVNACSIACIDQLPPGASGYISRPHTGGSQRQQPAARF